jgi:head-tail adaptor
MARRNVPLGHVPMEPGERDRLVTIQTLTSSIGSSGFPVESWATLRTAWMMKRDARGDERFVKDQTTAQQVTVWEAPYMADMDPELVDVRKERRLVYQGRAYDIEDASQVGRRDGIEFTTIAGVKAA